MLKIGFGSADWSRTVKDENGHPVWGGSGWARLGQYADKLDHDVVVGTLVSNKDGFGVRDWDGKDHFDLDIVVMQRFMVDEIAADMVRFKGNGQLIVNDIDDWYWGLSPSNNAWLSSHPKTYENENINHYKTILARSDLITCSTPYLRDRISQWVKCPIELIGNSVDVSRFKPRNHTSPTPSIGWVGSTSHRSGDLERMKGILGQFSRNGHCLVHSGHLNGAPLFADAVGVPEDDVATLPLVAPEFYPNIFTFDIGIVPLTDIPFNNAKSYIKGLEYAAAGIPFVASHVGEYIRLREEFGIGRTAKNPQQWVNHFKSLFDPEVRNEEAKRALELLQQFDVSVATKRLKDVYESYSS